MALKRVPLVAGMFGSDDKLDLKAIYRRKKQDNWGTPHLDASGALQWDLTGPLPLRRHHDWTKKGFEYVTLADEQSLKDAANALSIAGFDWHEYANQDRRTRSPFSQELYLADAKAQDSRELTELQEMVDQYGAEAVIGIRRKTEPTFELPASIKQKVARKGAA